MQFYLTDIKIHDNPFLNPDEPLSICEVQKQEYQSARYFYEPRYHIGKNNKDYKGAIEACAALKDSEDVQTCFRGIGSTSMKLHLKDPPFTNKVCQEMPSRQGMESCYSGAASYYTIHIGSTKNADPICEAFELEFQTTCHKTIEASKGFFLD